jgi:hypothetical protein
MNLLLGIGALITWILSDIYLGIKIKNANNLALKTLFIAINVTVIIVGLFLFYI